jgi:hypothetical protein
MGRTLSIFMVLFTIVLNCFAQDPGFYVKKDSWQETVFASREALMQQEKARGGGITLDFSQADFTVATWIKTTTGGPIFAKSKAPGVWEVGSKILSIS